MAFFTKEDKTYGGNVPRWGRIIPCALAILILIFAFIASITTVPTGHTGVVTTFGQVEDYTFDSGVHLKLPWQKVVMMDNRIQKQTVNLAGFSSDIQEVTMVYTVNYQINKANAQNIYRNIGINYYDTVITPCITESTKVVIAKYSAESLVGERTDLAMTIEKELAKKLAQYNIEIVSTSIEDMDFTDAFTNAVEQKQVAQQNKLRAETEAEQARIVAEANAEVKRIEAEAEAEANRTITESLSEEILMNKYLEIWNGELPMVTGSDGNLISIPFDMGD